MAAVYNSPPGWPAPPDGWMPEPGWQPDPRWGPAPAGWQFWINPAPEHLVPGPSMPSDAGEHELRVFLSYRRTDCQAQANGLYDGLRNRLPAARVFMDIDSIPPGADFEEYIRREISACDIVLVMIGDNWLDPRQGSDVRRIDEPGDFVRLEIESALTSERVLTWPVLVENVRMPSADLLPRSIARLSRLQGFTLSDLRWRADLDSLVAEVEKNGRERGKVGHAPFVQPHHLTPANTEPPAARMPGGVVWLPVYTVGLGAGVPALWAGLKRPSGDPTRLRLFILSAALLVVSAQASFCTQVPLRTPTAMRPGQCPRSA